ncbi:allantoicase [Thalassolituus marinus]|uniref:Probable allantoicase n=1 Tax=Thalassolituus marinus TaxID=671053 RepID=A0ABS7ZW80_9GAMM|nr:allantoicase [Thalassolituus marinus]MCA6064845.1 allantoicase [Thalassolituus marinus]
MHSNQQHPYTEWVDLASRKLGGQVLSCSDDFFAEMENLIKPAEPVFIHDKYTDRGKWMDGWESRRKRVVGYDWAILKLGCQGRIKGFNVNTMHFAGNAPKQVSIEACNSRTAPDENTQWTTIVSQQDVQPTSNNFIDCESDGVWTHLRLNSFPDGGIARLRVYGEAVMDTDWFLPGEPVDLAFVKNGARPVECSDMFFSSMTNLIMPDRGINMGDGWETKRRRGGRECDWIIVKLAGTGTVKKVVVDTAHFKGNYPDGFSLLGISMPEGQHPGENADWQPIIERQKLTADAEHFYKDEVISGEQTFTHIKLNMYPDGGISRLRVFGFLAAE